MQEHCKLVILDISTFMPTAFVGVTKSSMSYFGVFSIPNKVILNFAQFINITCETLVTKTR